MDSLSVENQRKDSSMNLLVRDKEHMAEKLRQEEGMFD